MTKLASEPILAARIADPGSPEFHHFHSSTEVSLPALPGL